MFGLGDPEMILVFDGDLAGDVLAAKGFVARKPGGSIAVGFALVGFAVDGKKIERIGGNLITDVFIKILRTFLPGVGECYDVVDLKATRKVRLLIKD